MSQNKRSTKPILAVDFDGVIHSYNSGWQGAGVANDPPVPGAMAFLAKATEHFQVCISSSRSREPEGIECMRNYILDHSTRDPDVRDAIWIGELQFPVFKPAAFLTLDDRAIQFTGFFPEPTDLLAFKPWNKCVKLCPACGEPEDATSDVTGLHARCPLPERKP